MIKPSITFIALGASLCLSAWAAEGDKEETVSLDKLPAAVAKALKEQAGDEKITGLSKEKDEGKTVYEATFKKKGRVHDVTVDEDGKLVSDEETIPVSEAPKVIREAIEREFPGGKIEKGGAAVLALMVIHRALSPLAQLASNVSISRAAAHLLGAEFCAEIPESGTFVVSLNLPAS